MSSGQSLRNGSSVEPGLPNTFLIPNARSRSSVACLTVVGLVAALAVLGGNGVLPQFFQRHCEEQSDEAISSFRGDAKHRTRNLEIPGLVLADHSGRMGMSPTNKRHLYW